jgi:hypothetical protein
MVLITASRNPIVSNLISHTSGKDKTKYIFMSCHQTTGRNHYMKAANKSFENMAKFISGIEGKKLELHS